MKLVKPVLFFFTIGESFTNLCSQKAFTFLFDIVIDDPGHFLLPNLQTVNIDIVLDVLKRPSEAVHSLSQTLQARHQLTHLFISIYTILFPKLKGFIK